MAFGEGSATPNAPGQRPRSRIDMAYDFEEQTCSECTAYENCPGHRRSNLRLWTRRPDFCRIYSPRQFRRTTSCQSLRVSGRALLPWNEADLPGMRRGPVEG